MTDRAPNQDADDLRELADLFEASSKSLTTIRTMSPIECVAIAGLLRRAADRTAWTPPMSEQIAFWWLAYVVLWHFALGLGRLAPWQSRGKTAAEAWWTLTKFHAPVFAVLLWLYVLARWL